MGRWNGPERRAFPRLSQEQIDSIKEQLLESIYQDIGRSVVKKLLWIVGALIAALGAWAAAKGYFR